MYAKIDGSEVKKYPYTMRELQKDNPRVSFPVELTDELKLQFNIANVHENTSPDFDPLTENIIEAAMTVVDGVAQINYAKESASTSEKESRIRNQRDSWLKGSDYMALSDVTMPDVWKTYRQDLRNVPQQGGFPDNVTWPLAPEDNKVV
tara:strand:- start:291 stop:737 length:447 start_codon:yes stop_codon:yes gene_type:complete